MPGSNMWYIRRHGEVNGPYPAGLVSRYILLGRVKESDEVSSNGTDWFVVKNVPELTPEILKGDTSDPMVQERILAAKRWADERSLDRRGGRGEQSSEQGNRRGDDRRDLEQQELVGYRVRREYRDRESFADSKGRWSILMIVGTVAVAAGIFLLFYQPPPPPLAGPDCQSPAAPNVNWSNCIFDGAQLDGRNLSGATLYSASLMGASFRHATLKNSNLSYAALSIANLEGADLQGAILVGVKLRQAKLNNANLDNADLSYADLAGTEMAGVSMENTKLGNAIWTDGRRCLPQSVGSCDSEQ